MFEKVNTRYSPYIVVAASCSGSVFWWWNWLIAQSGWDKEEQQIPQSSHITVCISLNLSMPTQLTIEAIFKNVHKFELLKLDFLTRRQLFLWGEFIENHMP